MIIEHNQPIAVIADIHGNIWALDAVLKDIQGRGIQQIINLGDNFWGPLEPAQTADRLLGLEMINISGNEDRLLIAPNDPAKQSMSYQFTMKQLQAAHLHWLEQLPQTYVDDQLVICHGTPDSDETYLLEQVTEHGVVVNESATLSQILKETPQKIILCAHSHVPRLVSLNDQLILNPGSVGVPAYSDDSPFPHAMETYSPHARYAIISRGANRDLYTIEQLAISYPWQAAVTKARQNGREDWAYWLETGRGTP
ncbi:MAG: metallophosphoesterase family protein [Chloroflexota bacterium]